MPNVVMVLKTFIYPQNPPGIFLSLSVVISSPYTFALSDRISCWRMLSMFDREALRLFARQPVSQEMVEFLASTTSSVIQVKPTANASSKMGSLVVTPVTCVPLTKFINRLIEYSNVQAPTLMASLVYLNRLRNILPGNAVGMETTRHRIFLAALILSAKSLNDSSPLNKHWTKYTDGLMTNTEVNSAERELIGLLKWNLNITEDELVAVLQPFLVPIKQTLQKRMHSESAVKQKYYKLSNNHSSTSLASRSSSKYSIFSHSSTSSYSLKSESSSYSDLSLDRIPLGERSMSSLNNSKIPLSKRTNFSNMLLPPAQVR